MTQLSLQVTKRTVMGRKVKKLRREGMVPGNIFGKKISSIAIAVNHKDLKHVLSKAGETSVVNVTIDDEKKAYPVLITHVSHHPVTHEMLHIDLHNISLTEKVHARVPLVLRGEALAVIQKIGALLTSLHDIEVEALPTDLPEHIDVDITPLAALDQELKVGDLKVDRNKLKLLVEDSVVIVKVTPLVSKEAEELAKQEAAAKAAAVAAAAPAEGAVPAAEGVSATPVKEAEAKAPTQAENQPKTAEKK